MTLHNMQESRKVLLSCLLVSLFHQPWPCNGSIFDIIPAGKGMPGVTRSSSSTDYKKSTVFSHLDEFKNNLKQNLKNMKRLTQQ